MSSNAAMYCRTCILQAVCTCIDASKQCPATWLKSCVATVTPVSPVRNAPKLASSGLPVRPGNACMHHIEHQCTHMMYALPFVRRCGRQSSRARCCGCRGRCHGRRRSTAWTRSWLSWRVPALLKCHNTSHAMPGCCCILPPHMHTTDGKPGVCLASLAMQGAAEEVATPQHITSHALRQLLAADW